MDHDHYIIWGKSKNAVMYLKSISYLQFTSSRTGLFSPKQPLRYQNHSISQEYEANLSKDIRIFDYTLVLKSVVTLFFNVSDTQIVVRGREGDIPPKVQMERREETESIELSKAEAVAVWYGSIVSTQKLSCTGDLLISEEKIIRVENQIEV